MYFFYDEQKDIIDLFTDKNASNGWKFNFKLFGGFNLDNNTIQLFNYYIDPGGYTSRLSITPIIDHQLWYQNCNWTCFVYIPGEFIILYCTIYFKFKMFYKSLTKFYQNCLKIIINNKTQKLASSFTVHSNLY